jgi:hypothetical protein
VPLSFGDSIILIRPLNLLIPLSKFQSAKNENQCLSSSQKNRIKESDSYTVEVILTSSSLNFLSEQIQAVQLEVSEISFACARSATDIGNCPSGSSQE